MLVYHTLVIRKQNKMADFSHIEIIDVDFFKFPQADGSILDAPVCHFQRH